jgi:two-component system, sensor histidine kinase and response regulator
MNIKQLDFPNIIKPFKNTTSGKNRDSKLQGFTRIITHTGKASEKQFRLRMKEMEELNVSLENLVEQRTEKLNEVVATNTKFISIIAHDLRSPFSSIIGALDVLKECLNEFSKTEIETYVNLASKSAHRTLNLLDNLLAWTISQNKEEIFTPIKINLCELVAYEIDSFMNEAKQKQITVGHSIVPNLNVSADIQMVKTIFRNLISNAVKFTKTGGEIAISASEHDHFVEIAVKDNGVGISNEVGRELFKMNGPHTVGTWNEQGTGLGLLLCKEFVEMHGGNIWIESKPGKGSTFKFTLPHYL